jgi:mannosyltransferase
LLLIIVAIAAALDLYRLGSQPFWRDEALSVAIARLPASDFIRFVSGYEPFMAAYVLLLRGWLYFGQNEFMVRLPSAFFAAATIPAVYVLGGMLFDDHAGLVAALLLGINGFSIQYAQEARAYTMVSLAVLCSWICLLSIVAQPRRVTIVFYIFATALIAYCNIIAMVTLPAQWCALCFLWPSRDATKRVIAATGIIALLVAPAAFMIWHAAAGQGAWIQRPDSGALYHLAARFLNLPASIAQPAGGAAPSELVIDLEAAFALAFLVLAALGAARTWIRQERERSLGYLCAGVGAILPIIVLFAVSQLKPLFVVRYLFFCLPFFALLMAAGICELRRSAIVIAGLTGLVVFNLWADWKYYAYPYKPDWRSAISYFSAHVRQGDELALVEAFSRWSFDYNLARFDGAMPSFAIVFPRWDGLFRVDGHYPNSAIMMRPNPALMAALAPTYARLWVISEDPKRKEDPVFAAFNAKYRYRCRRSFRRISVTLYGTEIPGDEETVCEGSKKGN